MPFPSTTVPVTVGERLVDGEEVRLVLGGCVHEGGGSNVSASTVGDRPRLVLSAHLDSKSTTPGVFDNAGSVAAVLAAVEHGRLLQEAVEVVFFNGEDSAATRGCVGAAAPRPAAWRGARPPGARRR